MSIDWSTVKNALVTIAPWIAGTLGTPIAGTAVAALENVFGLTPANGTSDPSDIMDAITGATPDQLLALKQADLKHKETMAQLGFDNIQKLEETAASDRDSARKREMTVKDWTPRILAYLIVGGFLGMAYGILFHQMSADSALGGTVIGYLSAKAEQVAAYYFGSSSDAAEKTKIIANQMNPEGSSTTTTTTKTTKG